MDRERIKWIVLPCGLVAVMVIVFVADLLGQRKAKEPEQEVLQKFSHSEGTSLVQLLAAPEKFHGEKIQVKGFLHVQFEDSAIYLSKDDASHGIRENSFWVQFENGNEARVREKDSPPEPHDFDGKYVCIEGTFDREACGHLNLWQGTIGKVTKIYELKAN